MLGKALAKRVNNLSSIFPRFTSRECLLLLHHHGSVTTRNLPRILIGQGVTDSMKLGLLQMIGPTKRQCSGKRNASTHICTYMHTHAHTCALMHIHTSHTETDPFSVVGQWPFLLLFVNFMSTHLLHVLIPCTLVYYFKNSTFILEAHKILGKIEYIL